MGRAAQPPLQQKNVLIHGDFKGEPEYLSCESLTPGAWGSGDRGQMSRLINIVEYYLISAHFMDPRNARSGILSFRDCLRVGLAGGAHFDFELSRATGDLEKDAVGFHGGPSLGVLGA